MKIDGPEGIHSIPNSEKNTSGPEKPDQGFQEIFQKALKPDEAQTISPATTNFVRPIMPLMETDSSTTDKTGVVETVENLLDLLEDYRRQLMTPECQLKDLDALVQKLDKQQKRLTPVMEKLPEGDELKTILNESLVTASVELFKFRRGDYLAL